MEKQNVSNEIFYENCNPNKEYSILYIGAGEDNNISEMGEELITDGDISSMIHRYKENDDTYRSGSIVVELKNASYVIIQRLSNKKVDYIQIFTNIEEEAKLNKMKDIANVRHMNRGELLTTKRPYVRKIIL